jgi:GH25 family lysozyme M1 (1,4-beta-N-acetylmuramidase)
VANPTKNKEKAELIVGISTIAVALILLVVLFFVVGRIGSELDFFPTPSKPSYAPPTTTLPLPTEPPLIPNPYDSRDFAYKNGYLTCLSGESWLGVDVSEYQGQIDWQTVASKNIRFAIIRMGARAWGETGQILTDSRWEENLAGAKAAGLLTGVYFFSQAISVEEAKEEAQFVLEKLDGQHLDMPIVFDWEFIPDEDARTANISREMLNSCAIAFCEEVKAAGYQPMVYFNPDLAYRILDLQLMQKQGYPFWLAMYANALTYPHRVEIWQYTSGATVMGIDTPVDLNLLFIYDEKDAA